MLPKSTSDLISTRFTRSQVYGQWFRFTLNVNKPPTFCKDADFSTKVAHPRINYLNFSLQNQQDSYQKDTANITMLTIHRPWQVGNSSWWSPYDPSSNTYNSAPVTWVCSQTPCTLWGCSPVSNGGPKQFPGLSSLILGRESERKSVFLEIYIP